MRRKYMLTAILGAAALGVAACGNTAGTQTTTAQSTQQETVAESTHQETQEATSVQSTETSGADDTAGESDVSKALEEGRASLGRSNDVKFAFSLNDEEKQVPESGTAQMTMKYQKIQIDEPGYETLQAAVDESDKEAKAIDEQAFSDSASMMDQDSRVQDGTITYAIEDTVQMKRADEKVFSYTRTDYSDLGGAHPFTQYLGYNFNSATGTKLGLEDVVVDYDKLYDYVLETLQAYNSDAQMGGLLVDGYEDYVKDMFYTSKNIQWFMEDDGLTVYFNAYDIAAYAAGPIAIKIPYQGHEDLLAGEFWG